MKKVMKMKKRDCIPTLKKIMLIVVGISLNTFSGVSSAAPIFTPQMASSFTSMASLQPVPDNELATMRGRFVDDGVVSYFGIELLSEWVSANGTVLKAGVDLSGNPNSGSISEQTVASVTPGSGSSSNGGANQTVNSGGLNNINGIAQTIQVAGVGNNLGNTLTVNILNPNAPNTSGSDSSLPSSNSSVTEDGDTADAYANNNGVGTYLVIPGEGVVLQQIGTSQDIAAGITQRIVIQSNFNNVQNLMNLSVVLNSQNAFNVGSAQVGSWLLSLSRTH
jgi:hypothetical protein